MPIAGDWNGDGTTSVGVFDPSTATFYLRNTNGPGGVDYTPFQFGGKNWIPVVGDWNGDGKDSVGVVDPSTGAWYLRNELSSGSPDAGQFQYGAAGWKPLAGDFAGPGNQQLLAAARPGPGAAPLTADALAGVVQEALARLSAVGVNPTLLGQLSQATFTLAKLPPGEVGVTVGGRITLDPTADDYGWYAGASDDADFARVHGVLTAKAGGAAAGRADLLTVVLHELAHVAGRPDAGDGPADDLMDTTLPVGVRRTDGLRSIFGG